MRRPTAGPALALLIALILAGCSPEQPKVREHPDRSLSTSSETAPGDSSPEPVADPSSSTAPTERGTGQVPRARNVQSPVGAKFDWGRLDLVESYLDGLQGGATFYELVWCQTETSPGKLDWSTADRIAAKARQVDAELMLKIRTGSCWATEGRAQHVRGGKNKTESLPPRDMAEYESFVAAAVERYAPEGVRVWAVENEINAPSFWGGTPQEYSELFMAGSAVIRATQPDALVSDPGLSSTTHGYGVADRLLREGRSDEAITAFNVYFERRMGTRGERIVQVSNEEQLRGLLDEEQGRRNLAYLSLVEGLAEQGAVDIRQVHFYEDAKAVPYLMEYLRATTPDAVRIEAWEVGSFVRGREVSDEESTVDLVKKTSLLLAAGVERVLWLPMIPNPDGRNSDEPRVGLVDPDGTVRAQGRMYAQIAADARGAEVSPFDRDGLSGVAFTKSGQTTAYLWASAEPVDVSFEGVSPMPVIGEGGATGTVTEQIPVRVSVPGTVSELTN